MRGVCVWVTSWRDSSAVRSPPLERTSGRYPMQLDVKRVAWALVACAFARALVPPAVADKPSGPAITAVDAVAITVSDMDRAVDFYSRVLTFEKESDREVVGEEYEHL